MLESIQWGVKPGTDHTGWAFLLDERKEVQLHIPEMRFI